MYSNAIYLCEICGSKNGTYISKHLNSDFLYVVCSLECSDISCMENDRLTHTFTDSGSVQQIAAKRRRAIGGSDENKLYPIHMIPPITSTGQHIGVSIKLLMTEEQFYSREHLKFGLKPFIKAVVDVARAYYCPIKKRLGDAGSRGDALLHLVGTTIYEMIRFISNQDKFINLVSEILVNLKIKKIPGSVIKTIQQDNKICEGEGADTYFFSLEAKVESIGYYIMNMIKYYNSITIGAPTEHLNIVKSNIIEFVESYKETDSDIERKKRKHAEELAEKKKRDEEKKQRRKSVGSTNQGKLPIENTNQEKKTDEDAVQEKKSDVDTVQKKKTYRTVSMLFKKGKQFVEDIDPEDNDNNTAQKKKTYRTASMLFNRKGKKPVEDTDLEKKEGYNRIAPIKEITKKPNLDRAVSFRKNIPEGPVENPTKEKRKGKEKEKRREKGKEKEPEPERYASTTGKIAKGKEPYRSVSSSEITLEKRSDKSISTSEIAELKEREYGADLKEKERANETASFDELAKKAKTEKKLKMKAKRDIKKYLIKLYYSVLPVFSNREDTIVSKEGDKGLNSREETSKFLYKIFDPYNGLDIKKKKKDKQKKLVFSQETKQTE